MIQLKDYMVDGSFPEGGNKLFGQLDSVLSQGGQIDIDMQGIIALPSMFMSASFGQAIQKYGINTIRNTVRFRNITRGQAERIKEYFNRFQAISIS